VVIGFKVARGMFVRMDGRAVNKKEKLDDEGLRRQ
jgi:hypothetical protein